MGHCAGSLGLQCGPSVSPFKDGTLRRKSSSAVWATCLTFQGWDIAQDVFVCSGVTVGQLSHPSRMGHCAGCLRLQWRCLRVQWSHCGPAVSPFNDGTLRRMCWSTVDSLWASCLTLQAWDIAQDVMVYRGVTVSQLSHSFSDGTLCRMSWSTVESVWASCLTLQGRDMMRSQSLFRCLVCWEVTVGHTVHLILFRMGHCGGCSDIRCSKLGSS